MPSDYKAFIESYGSGYIAKFLWLLNPFSDSQYRSLIRGGELMRKVLRELREDPHERFKPRIFPRARWPATRWRNRQRRQPLLEDGLRARPVDHIGE